jgi:hypothetical protein
MMESGLQDMKFKTSHSFKQENFKTIFQKAAGTKM